MKSRPQVPVSVSIGDPMPRITLPLASGGLFDSWHPMMWGLAIVYWLGAPPEGSVVVQLADALSACETLLYLVASALPEVVGGYPASVIDRARELSRAFGANGPLAVVVDASGRVGALLPAPTPAGVAALATCFYTASTPAVAQARAPVLLLERVIEPDLCQVLVEYWQRGDKRANEVATTDGNVTNADVKRRLDVPLVDPRLLLQVRDRLVRRVMPAIEQAFQTRIMVIEAPLIGCYDAGCGGWFRRHRDNSSPANAHRQFAVSINLNGDDAYEGGELRFPEFGRDLYRPVSGGALVFSASLVHEVVPVTRGRRIGVFTFLSATAPSVSRSLSPPAKI